jgi:PiT family inorganic phosphate transporter
MLSVLGGVYLGWSLGANDAANVFGSAVASRMVKFKTAGILAAIFVVLGAMLEGQGGIDTLTGLTAFDVQAAVVSSVAAAVAVTVMTLIGLPISTSQAVVGAIVGIGLLNNQVNESGLAKVVICWVGTPIGGFVIGLIVYRVLAGLYNLANLDLIRSDIILRSALVGAGAYGAYSLGANNVANVTAVFVGAGLLTGPSAALIGGLSISCGILTFSRPVMETVGKKLVRLDAFSALVVVLAVAVTAHLYAFVGVPVSTSQAVVGGVLAVGVIKGVNTIRRQTLVQILVGWFFTPVMSCSIASGLYFALHLQYVAPACS